jgi:hypothetical protein
MRRIKHIGFNTTCIVLQIKSGGGQTKTQLMDLMKNAKDRREVSSTDRFPGCMDMRCTNHFKKQRVVFCFMAGRVATYSV